MLRETVNAMRRLLWKYLYIGEWKLNDGNIPLYITNQSIVQVQYEDGTLSHGERWNHISYWKPMNDSCNIYMYRVVKY